MLQVTSLTLPAAPGTGTSIGFHVSQAHRVPVDILQEIVPYLQFKDYLNLSLLSKSVYVALPPRHTDVVIGNIHQLAFFAKYISGDTTRASALRSLHIDIDYPLPSEKPSALQDAQHNVHLILENAINLEELVCRGDATSDFVPEALTLSPRLSHIALQGLPPILTREHPFERFFPLTLRSLHVTRWYPHIIHSLPLAWILRLVSHLPALDTLTLEHHVFSLTMLRDETDSQQPGEVSEATPLPVLPSVQTLKLLGCSRGIVHPVFVQKLAQSLPNLATLHFDRTALPGRQSPAFAVDHLVLTNFPYKLERNPVPWRARRLTYVLARPNAARDDFSIAQCRVDLSPVLCLSITAPVIAPRTWDDLVANKWNARLLELESSVTSFAELVAPLVRVSQYLCMLFHLFANPQPAEP